MLICSTNIELERASQQIQFGSQGNLSFVSIKKSNMQKKSPYSDHVITDIPGRVVQSVTCLVTDAKLTADPGVASSIPARSHTFVEIDHEIISMVILLPSAE